jgi:hypothetical protein
LKEKEKGDTHVTFDDESAFFSHTLDLTLAHFNYSPEDVYFQCDEVDVYSKNTNDEPQYHVAFLSSMCYDCYESVDQNERDYSFLRLDSCDLPNNNSDIEYETLNFSVMSNMDDDFIDVPSKYYLQSADSAEPSAIVAQVSYDNGDESTYWIIHSESTHHMNGFANEFLSMTLEGYDDGLFVKGLVSSTKAYGIGSCIGVVKDSVGMYH